MADPHNGARCVPVEWQGKTYYVRQITGKAMKELLARHGDQGDGASALDNYLFMEGLVAFTQCDEHGVLTWADNWGSVEDQPQQLITTLYNASRDLSGLGDVEGEA